MNNAKNFIKAKFADFFFPESLQDNSKVGCKRSYLRTVGAVLAKKSFSLDGMFLGMPVRNQIIFAKRLAILIKSGFPILAALEMLERQAESKSAAKIYKHIKERVEKGHSLSEAMRDYEKIFGQFAINIVRVGEASGTLAQNLNYLADELKKKQVLRQNIIGAMVYPSFIVVATLGITILLTAYVFPKILPIFQSFKSQLPWSTRFLIAASFGLQHYWIHILAGLVALSVISALLLKIESAKLWFDRNNMRLPFFGAMFRNYYVANFTRTLGLLLKSELGIIDSLRIVGDTLGNTAYRREFFRISEGVGRGEKISDGMQDRLLFPPMAMQMVAVGETSGNLSSSLLYLSDMSEDELDCATKNLSTSIEPVLMIFMGLLVGFIALSIITPIYGITQNLHS